MFRKIRNILMDIKRIPLFTYFLFAHITTITKVLLIYICKYINLQIYMCHQSMDLKILKHDQVSRKSFTHELVCLAFDRNYYYYILDYIILYLITNCQ